MNTETKPSVFKAVFFSLITLIAFYLLTEIIGLILVFIFSILLSIPIISNLILLLFEMRGDGPNTFILCTYLAIGYFCTISALDRIVKSVSTRKLTIKLLGIYLVVLNVVFLIANIVIDGAWGMNIGFIITGFVFMCKSTKYIVAPPPPRAPSVSDSKQGEGSFLMEAANGMAVQMPESNLDSWMEAQKHSNKEKSLVDLFSFHLKRCCAILQKAHDSYTCEDEYDLYAIAYVVSDYAVAAAGKNRNETSDTILDFLFDELETRYPDKLLLEFRDRVDFYGSVVRGIPLHAHCLPGVDLSDANPIICCAIAFCDCLLNPAYIDDYSDYCPPSFGARETFYIASDVMEPLNHELGSLFKDIYTCAL